jgi:hypothetical protein
LVSLPTGETHISFAEAENTISTKSSKQHVFVSFCVILYSFRFSNFKHQQLRTLSFFRPKQVQHLYHLTTSDGFLFRFHSRGVAPGYQYVAPMGLKSSTICINSQIKLLAFPHLGEREGGFTFPKNQRTKS